MSAPTLYLRYVNQNLVYASGRNARDLLEVLTGRPPMWSVVGSAWVTTPRTARDALASAERNGWQVTTSTGDPLDALRRRPG